MGGVNPENIWLDGTTALPTFMPVATQAALKGLSQQQTEELGASVPLYAFLEN